MPTYQYECDACSHRFEQFQSMTAKPVEICPRCKSKVRRLIGSGAGILFKGSGFYQTDYRSESYRKKADAEKTPTSSEKKSEKTSDRPTEKFSDSKTDSSSSKGK